MTPIFVSLSHSVAMPVAILLRAAAEGVGLKMTSTRNLSRGAVAQICDLRGYPDFDRTDAFRFHKVANEPDFLPRLFFRPVAQFAKLLRSQKGYLKATPTDGQMLE